MSLANPGSSSIGAFVVAFVVFSIVLVVCSFSSCDVWQRSAKHACKAGGQHCLDVAKYYEARSEGRGIINFAMSNPQRARVHARLRSTIAPGSPRHP